MSGGHFNYDQYRIAQIAEELESLIHRERSSEVDEEHYHYDFTEETLQEFEKGLDILKKAYVYTQRIDWLVSGDDSEKTFHARLAEDLKKLDK